MTKSAEFNDLDQAVENLTHDLRYEYRAVEILRAVNSHAALVEALEFITRCCTMKGPLDCTAYLISDAAMAKARAALTLAKGA